MRNLLAVGLLVAAALLLTEAFRATAPDSRFLDRLHAAFLMAGVAGLVSFAYRLGDVE